MIDLRKLYNEGCCKPNLGCNVATTCMCALADDLLNENERLRAALQKIAAGECGDLGYRPWETFAQDTLAGMR